MADFQTEDLELKKFVSSIIEVIKTSESRGDIASIRTAFKGRNYKILADMSDYPKEIKVRIVKR